MKTRVIVSLILLPILLAVVLALPAVYTAILFAIMSVIAVQELLYTTKLVENRRLIFYAMLAAVAVTAWGYFGHPYTWGLLGFTALCILLFLEMVLSHARLPFSQVCMALFSGVVVPLLLTSLVRIRIMNDGKFYILVAFVIAFSADSGAYFAGRFFGKHKLAPTVSPKKTVEGAVGGMVSAVLCMLLYGLILQLGFDKQIHYGYAAIYGLVGSVVSILGDLAFSVVKRQEGIKDYGKIIPGHGGILDRFDSMTMVAPVAEVLILLLPMLMVK